VLPLPVTHDSPGPDEDASGALGLRDRKKRQARAAIVEAALALFAEDGYDATTVPTIAARAGVSPATVARYFPAKEAMLFPDRDFRVPALRAAIAARPPGEPPLRAVAAAVADQQPLDAEAQRRLALTRTAIARSAVLRGRALGMLGQWRDGIAEAVAERGGLSYDAARVLATAVVAVLDDVTERWAADGARGDLRALARTALAVLAGPGSGSDATADAAPDAIPDASPGAAPDAAPDTAPDAAMNAAPGAMTVDAPALGVIEQIMEFGDYRTVDDVKVPFLVKSINSAQTVTGVLSDVKHNVEIDEASFRKP
jgi:AcrR family transcriptional regulator